MREMTKENLEILEFEDKKTKAGKRYTRFKTSEGWMSCFDKDSCEKLKDFEGKTASVEIIEAGEFKNIKKFLGESEKEEKSEVEKKVVPKNEFPLSMKVSYAKDLIAQKGMTTEEAIKTVKDLIAGFEKKVEVKKEEVKTSKKEVKEMEIPEEVNFIEEELLDY